jgi:DNA-binding PadR family transcriptional regulator
MQELKLTPVSYVVLGFVSWAGEASPYQLKQMVAGSVGNFWTLQHAQLYTEPERLTGGGYLEEEREEGGRRRKTYRITERGEAALSAWREEPTDELPELRSPAVLKLFFGADPKLLAPVQISAHERKLAEYEGIRDTMADDVPAGPRLALDAGIGNVRQQLAWWQALLD